MHVFIYCHNLQCIFQASLRQEIKILQDKLNNNPEAKYYKLENANLQAEIKKIQYDKTFQDVDSKQSAELYKVYQLLVADDKEQGKCLAYQLLVTAWNKVCVWPTNYFMRILTNSSYILCFYHSWKFHHRTPFTTAHRGVDENTQIFKLQYLHKYSGQEQGKCLAYQLSVKVTSYVSSLPVVSSFPRQRYIYLIYLNIFILGKSITIFVLSLGAQQNNNKNMFNKIHYYIPL